MFTVEDYIEILAGIQENKLGDVGFNIDKPDYNLVTSLAKQTFKGVAFTDRQFELAKEKLLTYTEQFSSNGYTNIEEDFANLRMPIRHLDRSRWIKIVEYPDNMVYESYKTHHWIAVRFVFNKKLISLIEAIRSTDKDAIYDKENKIHYFTLSEKNIFNVVNALKDKNFEIDSEIHEKYLAIKEMNDNKENYVPGVYNLKLKNLHKNAIDYIISDVGSPTKDNLALYKDRQDLYGIKHFDQYDLDESVNRLTTLSQKIVNRKNNTILINSDTYNFDMLAESMLELDRFPILMILNSKTDHDELVSTYKTFRNVIPLDEFSVLYRKDNSTPQDKEFNSYISNNNLNNSLDTDPKIVYINKDKFPKTLLKTNWRPKAAIMFGSSSYMTNNKMNSYISELDLVIHFDNDVSPFLRNRIEKI